MTSPPKTGLIARKPPSKRSRVHDAQAKCLAMLIDNLESSLLTHCRVGSVERLPANRFEEIFRLDAYHMFLTGACACGFVCRDYAGEFPIRIALDRPYETVFRWDFPALRQYVHTLVRAERWAAGEASPVFEAISAGVLHQLALRLREDDTLYEPL